MADREVLPTPGVGSIEPSPLSRVLDRLGRWRDDLDAVVAAAQFSAGRSSGILTVAGELDASVAQVQRVMLDAVTSRRSAFQVVSLPPEDGHVGLDLLVWSARAGVAVALGYGLAFAMLLGSLRLGMPLGVAYGVWAAAGVALTAVASRYLFGEPLTRRMIGGIGLIMIGVMLIEFGAGH